MSRTQGNDMASDSADQMQQKIQVARRDAEALKDRIKRKKDELGDTSRKWHPIGDFFSHPLPSSAINL